MRFVTASAALPAHALASDGASNVAPGHPSVNNDARA